MNYQSIQVEESVNLSIKPILNRTLARFRALLPIEVELVVEVSHDDPRIRAHEHHIEEALLSAYMVAWQSMRGLAKQIMVEMKEILLDDVVLDPDAEKLGGGLPPRTYAWIVISNNSRIQAGPFHTLVPVPKKVDDSPSSARRLKLLEIRKVVDLHHGWMTVETEPEKGTTFEIYLPTAIPLEVPALNESGSDIKHIMYVDDYDAMRELISEMLPDAGFHVSCYESGNEALAAFLASPFKYDALISDYRLQGASGIDLMRQIKAMRPDLPVIIISGYVDSVLKAKAIDEGASLVISKSSDLSELCTQLRSLLQTAPNPALATYSEWAKL
jgi:CheY-like chemotaxis protein